MANLPPTIDLFRVVTDHPLERGAVTFEVRATDPAGAEDPLTFEFDFDDDGVADLRTRSAKVRHTYLNDNGLRDNGIFTATVIVSDGDGGESLPQTIEVLVENVEPALELRGPAVVDEGSEFVLDLSFFDPGDDTISSYTIDWGDGTIAPFDFTAGPELAQTHVYTDGGPIQTQTRNGTDEKFEEVVPTHTIRVFALADEDGDHTAVATLDVAVGNVAPTIDLTATPLTDANDPFELVLAPVSDPGLDEVTEFRIYWGDGSTFNGNPYQSFSSHPGEVLHTFADGSDVHTIRVELVDEDGIAPFAGGLLVANEGASVPVQLGELAERPKSVTLQYVGNEGSVNTSQEPDQELLNVAVTGNPFSDSEVFVVASDATLANHANASLMFLGTVNAGETFTVDAVAGGFSRLPRYTYIHVFSEAPVEITVDLDVDSSTLEQTLQLNALSSAEEVAFWTLTWGDGTDDTILGSPESVKHTSGATNHRETDQDPDHEFGTSSDNRQRKDGGYRIAHLLAEGVGSGPDAVTGNSELPSAAAPRYPNQTLRTFRRMNRSGTPGSLGSRGPRR